MAGEGPPTLRSEPHFFLVWGSNLRGPTLWGPTFGGPKIQHPKMAEVEIGRPKSKVAEVDHDQRRVERARGSKWGFKEGERREEGGGRWWSTLLR